MACQNGFNFRLVFPVLDTRVVCILFRSVVNFFSHTASLSGWVMLIQSASTLHTKYSCINAPNIRRVVSEKLSGSVSLIS